MADDEFMRQRLFITVFVLVYLASWAAPGVVSSLAITHVLLSDELIRDSLEQSCRFANEVGVIKIAGDMARLVANIISQRPLHT